MSILADVYPNNNNNKYINNIFKDTMDVILFQALNTIFQYTYKLNQNNIINRLHHSTKNIFYTNRNTFQIVPVCIFAYILLIPEHF
jgi:SLT domain-containing protein